MVKHVLWNRSGLVLQLGLCYCAGKAWPINPHGQFKGDLTLSCSCGHNSRLESIIVLSHVFSSISTRSVLICALPCFTDFDTCTAHNCGATEPFTNRTTAVLLLLITDQVAGGCKIGVVCIIQGRSRSLLQQKAVMRHRQSRSGHCNNFADDLIFKTVIPYHKFQSRVWSQVGRMNKLLQNVNLAGTSLFFQILGVRHSHSATLQTVF